MKKLVIMTHFRKCVMIIVKETRECNLHYQCEATLTLYIQKGYHNMNDKLVK